ncbi:MAG: PD-(D/E)XK nuclease family protein [Coriobacteriia bacterium]|nr:PD-(D/E)XK nuclease family protein [Coriobacteriia bacterium]
MIKVVNFSMDKHTRSRSDDYRGTRQFQTGTYSEACIESGVMGWKGIVDLLLVRSEGCEIIDFKSGEHSPDHELQLRAYAAIWLRAESQNAEQRRATTLKLVYPDGPVEVQTLSSDEDAELASQLVSRAEAARQAIVDPLPRATTSASECPRCQVRHLCEEYWQVLQEWRGADDRAARFVDLELAYEGMDGASFARGRVLRSSVLASDAPVLLRLTEPIPSWASPEQTMRVLGGRILDDTSSGRFVISAGELTEVYFV